MLGPDGIEACVGERQFDRVGLDETSGLGEAGLLRNQLCGLAIIEAQIEARNLTAETVGDLPRRAADAAADVATVASSAPPLTTTAPPPVSSPGVVSVADDPPPPAPSPPPEFTPRARRHAARATRLARLADLHNPAKQEPDLVPEPDHMPLPQPDAPPLVTPKREPLPVVLPAPPHHSDVSDDGGHDLFRVTPAGISCFRPRADGADGADAAADAAADGAVNGATNGAADGAANGAAEGAANGAADGAALFPG